MALTAALAGALVTTDWIARGAHMPAGRERIRGSPAVTVRVAFQDQMTSFAAAQGYPNHQPVATSRALALDGPA